MTASFAPITFPDSSISFKKLRETYPNLSDAAFKTKLQGALDKSPLMFFRSFVNTYYSDLSERNSSDPVALCLGDAHLENFGFLDFSGKTRFVFNDFDDSGNCPVSFDLLRYFVSLNLAKVDRSLQSDLWQEYVDVFSGNKDPQSVPAHLFPNLEKKRKQIISKYTQGKKFVASQELAPLSSEARSSLLSDLQSVPKLRALTILDIAESIKETGGSGGLQRYWLLVQKPQGLDLLELKELAMPGTSFGAWPQPAWSDQRRIEHLKATVWKDSPEFYDVIRIRNVSFLLRSRIHDAPDIGKLSNSELRTYLMAETGFIAFYHRGLFKSDGARLKDWIEKTVPVLSSRFTNTYKNLSKDFLPQSQK